MSSPEDVLKIIAEREITFVDFRFTDTLGREHHLTTPAHAVDEAGRRAAAGLPPLTLQITPRLAVRSRDRSAGDQTAARRQYPARRDVRRLDADQLLALARGGGDVRRGDDLRQHLEPVVDRRLPVEDVERRAADVALLKSKLGLRGQIVASVGSSSPFTQTNGADLKFDLNGSITAGGALDITDSKLIVDYAGASPLAVIRSYVASGALTSSLLSTGRAVGGAFSGSGFSRMTSA